MSVIKYFGPELVSETIKSQYIGDCDRLGSLKTRRSEQRFHRYCGGSLHRIVFQASVPGLPKENILT